MPNELVCRLNRLPLVFSLAALALSACSDDNGPPAMNGQAGMSSAGTGGAGVGGGGTNNGGSSGSAGSVGLAGGGSGGTGGAPVGPCAPAGALVCSTKIPFPTSLEETGIFPALPDVSQHNPYAHLFEPNPPLWSDGLAKERLVVLPADGIIDNSDPKKWKFPEGTLMVKTFFDDSGPNKARRPIETRFIRRGMDPTDPFAQWEFAVYQWNADSTDATLISFADPMMSTPVPVVVDRMENGKPLKLNDGQPFMHAIPSKQDCQACHGSNAKTTEADVIGFDELRLNWKLPGAEKTQLQDFVDKKLLSTMPAAPATISEADPVLARVKGWAYGNCVHCHNGAEGMLNLHPDVFVANTVNVAAEGAGIMPPNETWKRVVPKQPELSILFAQARRAPLPSGEGVQMRVMPPVGVAIAEMNRPNAVTDPPDYVGQLPPMTLPSRVPDDPIADLATWINSLP
jgi:hypothetical protein